MSALKKVHEQLLRLSGLHESADPLSILNYRIPHLWLPPFNTSGSAVLNNPAAAYASIVSDILNREDSVARTSSREWLATANIYCMLIRHVSGFQHFLGSSEIQGTLSINSSDKNWRCTGTFLKAIAMLPYLQSLGINTLYLLPLMSVGKLHRKGALGSVYAIRNLRLIDENLTEPLLELSSEDEFAALVEAAHCMGMRVLVEFALRTTSKDCDWIEEHPEWFYWIEKKTDSTVPDAFHPPHFDAEELKQIFAKVERGDFVHLPSPSAEYKSQFCPVPTRVELSENGEWIGHCEDGRVCVVPGAYADYPPDDTQPLWSDVCYLRIYNHPEFNYTAYNSVRMYDRELHQDEFEQRDLWDELSAIIPWYQYQFNIDGAVLDMSHALPQKLRTRIIQQAREQNAEFVFIEENFTMSQSSVDMGFDAVLGDMWLHSRSFHEFQDYVRQREDNPSPIHYLASPDTHNTPRVASRIDRSHLAEVFEACSHITKGIPCIVSGSEFGEWVPMNTGLGFSESETTNYPAESLALFSPVSLGWESADVEILEKFRQAHTTRE